MGKYDTRLDKQDEANFNKWAAGQKAKYGRDIHRDKDYDWRGWYKKNGPKDLGGKGVHVRDTFKKPSHTTFSEESIYHGKDGKYGG